MEAVIEARGLTKIYGGDLRAVDNVDLTVPRGIIFSLLGPNGAGKTTTVEILEGLRRPTSGEARVLGHDVLREYGEIRSRVGILPQDFQPFDRLTPRETVDYFARLFNRRLSEEDLDAIIGITGLEERQRVQARKLSGGEKRKLGIGLALVGNPELVFLDEPTTGLDPQARREVWKVIRALKDQGKTVLLTTHYLDEAENLADDVVIMNRGKIIAQGEPLKLIAQYGEGSELVLCGAASHGLEVLNNLGMGARMEGQDIIIRMGRNRVTSEVLMELAEKGVTFRDLQSRRESLEDVFLKLVGARMDEGELRL